MNFLPLDTLRPKEINERLRQLGPAYHLAIDVLRFDQAVEPAVRRACGSTVICDTLDDAR